MTDDGRKGDGFAALAAELEGRFQRSDATPFASEVFGSSSLRAFAHQYRYNETYRAFCDRRGRGPDSVSDWRDVPAVPAAAFKHLDLVSAAAPPDAVFRTSGTTRGPAARGRHIVPRLALYRASLLPPFRRHVAGGEAELRWVSLIPPASELPESSLSYMVSAAAEALGARPTWVVSSGGRMDVAALRASFGRSAEDGRPILLLGTALAYAHLLEALGDDLPPGAPPASRAMETGGFKGRSRAMARAELYGRLAAATGIPEQRIVSEYGMTELLSQLYEPVLSEGRDARVHVPPAWMRVRALDPVTLEERAEGEHGILAFFDLANLGSVCHVLTEDVGSVRDGRVTLTGRVPGAEPRGCSRAMDDLLAAARS